MTGPTAGVFVIIVNFRTGQLRVRCLASLAVDVSCLGSGRVIVPDNCSQDDSVTQISLAIRQNGWADWAELLPMPRSGGFAYGNNAAIARVRQLNPDFAAAVLPLGPGAAGDNTGPGAGNPRPIAGAGGRLRRSRPTHRQVGAARATPPPTQDCTHDSWSLASSPRPGPAEVPDNNMAGRFRIIEYK
jgi:hypothetical protein